MVNCGLCCDGKCGTISGGSSKVYGCFVGYIGFGACIVVEWSGWDVASHKSFWFQGMFVGASGLSAVFVRTTKFEMEIEVGKLIRFHLDYPNPYGLQNI